MRMLYRYGIGLLATLFLAQTGSTQTRDTRTDSHDIRRTGGDIVVVHGTSTTRQNASRDKASVAPDRRCGCRKDGRGGLRQGGTSRPCKSC